MPDQPSVIILTVSDLECAMLLDFVTKAAQLDVDGQKLPEGVKAPTHYTVGIAALREGLKHMAVRAAQRPRVGLRTVATPESILPFTVGHLHE